MLQANNSYEGMRVLLVEDNPEAMKLTTGMLHDLGITQVYTANNGAEAIDLFDSFNGDEMADLVLSDWNMPEITGMDLLKQIRITHPDMLFIMLTGQADPSSVAEARACGITGYITKPFSVEDLSKKLSVVSRVLDHRK